MLNENHNENFINKAAYNDVQIVPELPSQPVFSAVCPECNVLVAPGEKVCPHCGTKVKPVKSKKKSKQYSYLDLAFPEAGKAYRSFVIKSAVLYPLISSAVLVAGLIFAFEFLSELLGSYFSSRLVASWVIIYISFLFGTIKTVLGYIKARAMFKKYKTLDGGVDIRNAIIYSRQNRVHEDINILVGPDYIFLKKRSKAIFSKDQIVAFSKNLPTNNCNVIDIYDREGKKHTVDYPNNENYAAELFSVLEKACPQAQRGTSAQIRKYMKQLHR